jgi:large-conductance mechanosensitive channel
MYFIKVNRSFIFNNIVFYYKLSGDLFPYSTHKGAQSEIYNEILFNSSLAHSYVCLSGIKINMGDIIIHMKNLRLQPFFNKRPNLPFDAEIACENDRIKPASSNSLNYIFFSIAILLSVFIISCTLFIIIRCINYHREEQKQNSRSKSKRENQNLIIR